MTLESIQAFRISEVRKRRGILRTNLKIGHLASAAGVSRDTIRYYERLKMLPPPSRTLGGYRLYTDEDLSRVRFIKQAQALGLSLSEIRDLLPFGRLALSQCSRVRDLLKSKIEDIDQRMKEMRAFRKKLVSYLGSCQQALNRKHTDDCPVLLEISQAPGINSKRVRAGHGVLQRKRSKS